MIESLLNKYRDLKTAMKAVKTDAELAADEGDMEDFHRSTELYQTLEVELASKR